jgi:ligand-binding SRPBCC domain-containing protein
MKVYTLESTLLIPADIHSCWDFFSSPANLQKITPPSMGFKITSEPEDKMYPGQIITYKVKPLLGIAVTWVTEITHVSEFNFFVDEQRSGPYRFWHHKHFFNPVAGGVEMTDLVHYALPFGLAGRLVHFVVESKLQEIFEYRNAVVGKVFSGENG